MTIRDFVATCSAGKYKEINMTAHNLNDECRRQGIASWKKFVQAKNGVVCMKKICFWTENQSDFTIQRMKEITNNQITL